MARPDPGEDTQLRFKNKPDDREIDSKQPNLSNPEVSILIKVLKNVFGSVRLCLVVTVIGVAAVLFLITQGLQPSDDAYITFRHARNFADHLRPAWNLEGLPVLGSTTPVYMFILGSLAWMFGASHIESIALYFNAFLLFTIVVFTYLVVMELLDRPLPAILAATLVGFNSVNIFVFSLGFEAPLLVAVLLVSLYSAHKGRDAVALVLTSLAPLVRPEGILITPLVWGHILFGRRFRWRLVAVYLAIPFAWTAFAFHYYNSPIPHSIQAMKKFPAIYRPYKAEEVELTARLADLHAYTTSTWTTKAEPILFIGSLETNRSRSLAQQAVKWIALLGLPTFIFAFLFQRDGRMIYLLYPPLFIVLYAWIGRANFWYLPSFVTFSILLLFSGCAYTLSWLAGRTGLSRWKADDLAIFLVFLLFLTTNNYAMNEGENADPEKAPFYAEDPRGKRWQKWERERFEGYREAAKYLNAAKETHGDALISEVGVFGYFYEGPVFDAVGICSHEASRFYPPPYWDIYDENGHYRTLANNFVPTNMVMTIKPKYVVNSLVYVANLVQPKSYFSEEYTLINSLGEAWGHPILIFERSTCAKPAESH